MLFLHSSHFSLPPETIEPFSQPSFLLVIKSKRFRWFYSQFSQVLFVLNSVVVNGRFSFQANKRSISQYYWINPKKPLEQRQPMNRIVSNVSVSPLERCTCCLPLARVLVERWTLLLGLGLFPFKRNTPSASHLLRQDVVHSQTHTHTKHETLICQYGVPCIPDVKMPLTKLFLEEQWICEKTQKGRFVTLRVLSL